MGEENELNGNALAFYQILHTVVREYVIKAIDCAGIDAVNPCDMTACISMLQHGNWGKTENQRRGKNRQPWQEIETELENLDRLDQQYLTKAEYDKLAEEKEKIRELLKEEQGNTWDNLQKSWRQFKGRDRRGAYWQEIEKIRQYRNNVSHISKTPDQQTDGRSDENRAEASRSEIWLNHMQDDTFAYDVMQDLVRTLEKLRQKEGARAVEKKIKEHFLIRSRQNYNWIPEQEFFSVFSGKGVIRDKLNSELAKAGELRKGHVNLTGHSFRRLRNAELEWREKSKGWENTEPYSLETFLEKSENATVLVAKSALQERSFLDIYRNYLSPLYTRRQQQFCCLRCSIMEMIEERERIKNEADHIADDRIRAEMRVKYRSSDANLKLLKQEKGNGSFRQITSKTEESGSRKVLIQAAYQMRLNGPLVLITQSCEESRALFDLFRSLGLLEESCFLRIQNDKLCGNQYYGELV